MPPSAADVQKLYIAYFNRPAEPEGLRYWTGVEATLDNMAAAFSASTEFQQRYANMSNTDMVKAMYHHLFGRAGDAGGVAYWSGQLDSGAIKADYVALALLRGAQGDDAVVLANKAQLAQEWTAQVPVLLPYVADRDMGPISAMWLEQVTDTASLQYARTAMAGYMASPGTSTLMVSGQAQGVGYLRDATVFIDSNNNGMLDSTEGFTKTDANGHFLIAAAAMADFPQSEASFEKHLLVTGGFDLATQRAHNGTLSLTFEQQHSGGYPATTLVRATVSAMTTLHDAIQRKAGLEAADARMPVPALQKFSASADNLTIALDADSATRPAALSIYAINAQIDGIAEVVARTLQMLSAKLPVDGGTYVPPKLSLDLAMRATYEALGDLLAVTKGRGPVDSGPYLLDLLTMAASLQHLADGTVLDGTAAKSLSALSTATLDAFSQIMGAAVAPARADIGDTSEAWATLAHVAQVRAALDDLADTLPRAVAENKAAALLPQWTAAAVKERIAAKDVGNIDPYSHGDDAAMAQANGTPPALDKLAVEQAYVAMLNRPAAPDALQKWMAKGDVAALSAELAALPEWQGKNSDALIVDTLYMNLFGHHGDVSGLAYWTGVLHDQKTSVATLAQYLVQGAVGSDAVAARNKVLGALEYTSALATPELAEAYRGEPLAGNYWVTGITDDATLKNALDLLPDFLVSGGPVVVIGMQEPSPL